MVIVWSSTAPVGPVSRSQAWKNVVVVFEAHGLEHLDADDLVEPAREVAVVLEEQRDPAACLAHGSKALGRIVVLFAADGRGGHAAAVVRRGIRRKTAPAGANLQEMVVGNQLQLAADAVELLDLRALERVVLVGEPPARVGQRRMSRNSVKNSLPRS